MKDVQISMNEAVSRQKKNVVELCCRLLSMNINSKHNIIVSSCFMLIPVEENTLKL